MEAAFCQKDETIDPEKKEAVKMLREKAKKMVKDLQETCFYETPEELAEDLRNTGSTMEELVLLVTTFARLFAEKKRSRNVIDFQDMEQFALQILTEEKDGSLVPSAVAREYQEQFEEVMIDEYQDSNLIQEAILTSVSTVSRGSYNVFMVGDVKQSIYRFRLSRPELFMENMIHTARQTARSSGSIWTGISEVARRCWMPRTTCLSRLCTKV